MKTSLKRIYAGFTLIEVLVSMVISVFLLTLVMGGFAALIQTNQRNNVFRDLQKQSNFALVRLADNMRNGSVDYQAYETGGDCQNLDLGSPLERVCLGDETLLEYRDENLWLDGQPLFSDVFHVEKGLFTVLPALDPFSNIGTRSAQLQPKVHFYGVVTSRQFPKISIPLQTTISSRSYTR